MGKFNDARGLAWTASDQSTAQGLFGAIDRFLTYRADTLPTVDAILERDPECPGAWILKGFLLLFARKLSLVPQARDIHAQAEALSSLATPHERMLTQALGQWANGDLRAAQATLDANLSDHPLDLLALRLQHMNAIFFGRPEILRSTITRALSDWDDNIPGAGFVYGMACMGLEEVGAYERAEHFGRRGVELEPDDLWSVHSVAHVMEAQGRLSDGIEWMQRPDSFWTDRSPMRHHLWWHEALFHFEAADYDRVLEFYDARLNPTAAIGYLEMSNCVSLLHRLEVAGVGCGDRWTQLVDLSIGFLEDRALTFADVHLIVALSVAGSAPDLQRFADSLGEYSGQARTFDQRAAQRISYPLARAMQARLAGQHQRAADMLMDIRLDFPFMGGSIAQRDMLEFLLIETSIAAGRVRVAKRLIDEYLDSRPHSVPIQTMREHLAA